MTRTCPEGCDVRPWTTDTPCPLCDAPGEGLPEDAAPKRGRGQPPKPGTRRTIRPVMTDTEWEAARAKAREHGIPLTELVRAALAAYPSLSASSLSPRAASPRSRPALTAPATSTAPCPTR